MNQVTTAITKPAPVIAAAQTQNSVMPMDPPTTMKLADEIEFRTEQFKGSLPTHIPVERFKKVLIVAVNTNPKLIAADRRSFFNSALKAANDGLLPDGRDGALVIYSTKVKEGNQERWADMVQWMPMIGGIRKKVRNSGEIATWVSNVVYEHDEFDFELSSGQLSHRFKLGGNRGKMIGAYSKAQLKSGETSIEVMDADEILSVWRKSSKSKDKQGNPTGPWKDHEGEMWRKTVARRHSKVLPMSTDLDDLMRRDDALYNFEGKSDKNILDASNKRPQLADFTKQQQSTVETVDETTGEITETAEYGAADAYEDGAKAKAEGKDLTDMPINLRAFQNLSEAWIEGFNSEAE